MRLRGARTRTPKDREFHETHLRRVISLAMLVATPGLATADSTHQQAINVVIARALSQRGVPFAYGGGNISGPSLGTASVDTPAAAAAAARPGADPLHLTSAPPASTSALLLAPSPSPA